MRSSQLRRLAFEALEGPMEFEFWGGNLSLDAGSRFVLEEAVQTPVKVAKTTLRGSASFYRSARLVRKFEKSFLIATFMESGELTHRAGYEYSARGPVTLISKPSGGYHAYLKSDKGRDQIIYQVLIPPHMLARAIHAMDLKGEIITYEDGYGKLVYKMVEILFDSGPLIGQESIDSIVDCLMSLLGKCIEGAGLNGARKSSVDRHFAEISHFIDRNISDENLDGASISRSLGISKRYISLILKQNDISLSTLICDKRLALAHTLLSSGRRYKAVEIASLCGFRSVPNFHRVFKARYGVTPMAVCRACTA